MINPSKVLFITDSGAAYLFKDLLEVDGLNKYIYRMPKSRWLNYIFKFHTNKKIAHRVWLPKRDVWFDYDTVKLRLQKMDYMLVNSSAMALPSMQYWEKLKAANKQCKFILLLVDSLHSHSAHIWEVKKRINNPVWDEILSYDKNDCIEYGLKYINYSYYSTYENVGESDSKSDLYYISSVKPGRSEYLKKVRDTSKKNGVNFLCKIYSLWRRVDYGIAIRKVQPYIDVVRDINSTNCILEILQSDQKVQSIRYLEAVCYNKKLLTNNKNIDELPYYDSRYMRYIDDIENIDWNWVKRRENIDYGYKGDFSAENILKYIQ